MKPKYHLGHLTCYINAADFEALQRFEERHPDLYKDAISPVEQDMSVFGLMNIQMQAFNIVFDDDDYGDEFRELIEQVKNK